MIMQPIRTWSLKFVATLRGNELSWTVREPLQTLHEAEETFLQSTIEAYISCDQWWIIIVYPVQILLCGRVTENKELHIIDGLMYVTWIHLWCNML